MADEAKIKVNGTALPTPSEISVEISDLDSDSVRPVSIEKEQNSCKYAESDINVQNNASDRCYVTS